MKIIEYISIISIFVISFVFLFFIFIRNIQEFPIDKGCVSNVIFEDNSIKLEITGQGIIRKYDVVDYQYVDELKTLNGKKVLFTHNTGVTKRPHRYYSVLLSIKDINNQPLPYVHPYKHEYIWFNDNALWFLGLMDLLLILFVALFIKKTDSKPVSFDRFQNCIVQISKNFHDMGINTNLDSHDISDDVNVQKRYFLSCVDDDSNTTIKYNIFCNVSKLSQNNEFKIWIDTISICCENFSYNSINKYSKCNLFPSYVWSDYDYPYDKVGKFVGDFFRINNCINGFVKERRNNNSCCIQNEIFLSEIDEI